MQSILSYANFYFLSLNKAIVDVFLVIKYPKDCYPSPIDFSWFDFENKDISTFNFSKSMHVYFRRRV